MRAQGGLCTCLPALCRLGEPWGAAQHPCLFSLLQGWESSSWFRRSLQWEGTARNSRVIPDPDHTEGRTVRYLPAPPF